MTHHTSSGSRPVRPSPARLEWLQIKADVEREAKEKARAARRAASAEPRPPLDIRPGTRFWRETRSALAEIGRNPRRWENA